MAWQWGMAGQAGQIQTVASQHFIDLDDPDIMLNPNFDGMMALERCMKVFRMTYAGFGNLIPDLYDQKFTELVACVCDMRGMPGVPDANDMQQFIESVDDQIEIEEMAIKVGAIRFRGRTGVTNARIRINIGIFNIWEQLLDSDNELQSRGVAPYLPYNIILDFKHIRDMRINGDSIRISLLADDWADRSEELREFVLNYRELPAEGFEDWFDFGRGVQLLIKVEIRVTDEGINDPDYPYEFHFTVITQMVWRRLESYRAQNMPLGTGHRPVANKSKVSYIRKRVDPNSDQAFWSTPQSSTDLMESIRTFRFGQTVRFNEIQIGFGFSDEYEDSVCLCSEWCNWNAFFYYNPIYRFLMVRHNQLYLQNRTHIPDMYLMAVIRELNGASQAQPIPKTPLLQLMSCANEYRVLYTIEMLKDPQLRINYNHSSPDARQMFAIDYNCLRYYINVVLINIQSDINPFADICIENIINYYKVLSDLHTLCGTVTQYVSQADRKKWAKEFDRISRKEYKSYIHSSYWIHVNPRAPFNQQFVEHLFSEDYEYSGYVPKNESEREVRRIRAMVTNVAIPANPFNVRLICSPLAVALISVHKFIQKVDPMLSTPRTDHSTKDVVEMCQRFDADFDGLLQPQFNFYFKTDPNSIAPDLRPVEKVFLIFYSLKAYFIAFNVQSYCIKSILRHNRELDQNYVSICSSLRFIWRNDWIEYTFRNQFNNQTLFDRSPAIVGSITEFYDNFWGKPSHERQVVQRVPTMDEAVISAHRQFCKLYVWQKNNGNQRLKFTRILSSLTASLEQITNKSEYLYVRVFQLYTRILSQRFEYYLEVLDILVYYLVKAICYMTLSSVTDFIANLEALQVSELVQDAIQYILSKPGWVPLIRTMRSVMLHLNRLKAYYIVFDDELNRIANALNETKRMAKEMYRILYQTLTHNWRRELDFTLPNPIPANRAYMFTVYQVANGIAFLAAFVDDFRYDIQVNRKWLSSVWGANFQQHPHTLCFNSLLPIVQDYIADPQERERALPLMSNVWRNTIQTITDGLQRLDGVDPQRIGIDLALADI